MLAIIYCRGFDIYPAVEGHSASFTLYEDDGETNDYKKDICSKTDVKCTSAKGNWNMSFQRRNEKGQITETIRNFGVKIHLDQAPQSIVFNSSNLKQTSPDRLEKSWNEIGDKAIWSWDKQTNCCWIKWPNSGVSTEFTIKK